MKVLGARLCFKIFLGALLDFSDEESQTLMGAKGTEAEEEEEEEEGDGKLPKREEKAR
jgi:hypothetical protein